MSTKTVIGDKVTLYSYLDRETETRVNVCATLPNEEHDGARLNVIDWKIDPDTKSVILTYQMRNDAYAPIFDTRFMITQQVSKVQCPDRSKNWKWSTFGDYWKNQKTGKEVQIY